MYALKKVFPLLIVALLALTLTVPAMALDQSEDFYVTDETGSLSRDTIDEVLEVNYGLEEDCGGAQIVVVFLDYFGDTYADEYAVRLFNDWRLSSRAMLLVVSPKEKRGGMTVGTELDDRFTPDDINRYLDNYFWDSFVRGRYDEAVTTLVGKLSDWFYDEYGVSGSQPSYGSSGSAAGMGLGGILLGFIFRNLVLILVVVLLIVLIVRADRRRYRGYYMSMGMPIPRYYPWYMFTARPYRRWRAPPPPPGPRGPGGFSSGSFGGRSGRPSSPSRPRPSSPRPSRPSRPSGGGRSGGSFGGRR